MYYVVQYNYHDPHEETPARVIGPFESNGSGVGEYYRDYDGWCTIVVGPGLQDYTPEEYRNLFHWEFEW